MAIAYPVFPAIALALAVISLVTMIYFNHLLAFIFVVLMAVAYAYFSFTKQQRTDSVDNAPAMAASIIG